jgi:hypothetical protein
LLRCRDNIQGRGSLTYRKTFADQIKAKSVNAAKADIVVYLHDPAITFSGPLVRSNESVVTCETVTLLSSTGLSPVRRVG